MALATQFVGPVQSEHRGLYCSRRQQEVLLEGLKYKALSFLHSLSDFLSSYFHLLFDTWFPWVKDTGHMQRAPRAAAHLLLCPIPPAHLLPCVLCLSPRWAVEQGISPSHSLTNLSLTLPSPASPRTEVSLSAGRRPSRACKVPHKPSLQVLSTASWSHHIPFSEHRFKDKIVEFL
jgi:hypothetical protein